MHHRMWILEFYEFSKRIQRILQRKKLEELVKLASQLQRISAIIPNPLCDPRPRLLLAKLILMNMPFSPMITVRTQ